MVKGSPGNQAQKGDCGEQLWQPDLTKRNYLKPMPAQYIKSKLKKRLTSSLLTSATQYKNQTDRMGIRSPNKCL
jgi:hypothetical protein